VIKSTSSLLNFSKTVLLLAESLQSYQYAFRGTASLFLQGIEMNVDDIDILSDKETALSCNELLKEYLLEEVSYKESKQFKSYFGKFNIEGMPVEIMGEWQIKDVKGNWTKPYSAENRIKMEFEGKEIYVISIEEELLFFAKMGRWTAYQKIKRQLEEKKGKQKSLF